MDDRHGGSLFEIEIGIVVPAVIYAPVWLADQRGFLRGEGLTVRLRSFGSTGATTAVLRDGVVPITISSPEGSILNALDSGDLRLVSGFVNRPPLSMIAQPRYHMRTRTSPAEGFGVGTSSSFKTSGPPN
jgi:ABC-type nitrate/sulfonate/bicarbonate transport system substrate-binding protein